MSQRMDIIRQRLEIALSPSLLELTDDSHLHIGHEGAKGGAGHYSVRIASEKFSGLNRIRRHQLVYAAVADMMPHEIHALCIEALAEDENPG